MRTAIETVLEVLALKKILPDSVKRSMNPSKINNDYLIKNN